MTKSHDIGFGFYHLFYDGETPDFEQMAQSDFANTFMLEHFEEIPKAFPIAKAGDCRIWTTCQGLFRTHPVGEGIPTELLPDWKARVDEMVTAIRATGCWDTWLGFYFDEPMMWLVTNDMLHEVTRYMHEAAPDKRIFVCFCISGIDMNAWTTKGCEEIDAHGSAYLTDVAFDLYAAFDEKEFTRLADRMKGKMANPDVKIWYIPGVMILGGIQDEAMAVEHVDGLLELLRKEKNPGGLVNFTYRFIGGDCERPGVSEFVSFFDESRPTTWPRLKERLETVGRTICRGGL